VPESFALDGASNVTNRSGTAETYDAANRLRTDGGTTNAWSDADRLTQRGSDIFGYDALDRLRTSTVAGTARSYTYNGDSLLKSRTQGTATQFLWDPSSSPSRLLKQGSDNIIYGLGPLYVVKADATTLTFARDGSKNVRAEVSSTGAVTAAFRYRAYGQTAQGTIPAPSYLGLASQLIDPSGLYYMRARWYEPTTGRFMSRDPLAGDTSNPSTFNGFGYASGRPGSAFDPSGLRDISASEGEGTRCDLGCSWNVMLNGFTHTFATMLPAPPSLPDSVLDLIAGDNPGRRLTAEVAWQQVAGLFSGVEGPSRLYRFGRNAESAERLAAQAADAEAHGLPHGVSVRDASARSDAASALRAEVEEHFGVTQTGADPHHFTVELPKPVTDAVANVFNVLFGRR
jgi:RHS repeat-associated protein